jgi:hypothetical protein
MKMITKIEVDAAIKIHGNELFEWLRIWARPNGSSLIMTDTSLGMMKQLFPMSDSTVKDLQLNTPTVSTNKDCCG